MKSMVSKLIILVAIIILIGGIANVFAVNMPNNPGYDPNNLTSPDIATKANSIMGTFVYIVNILAVATMIFMGLRYMFSSSDVKADIKKNTVTWVIGAIIVFAATTLVGLVLNVVVGDRDYVTVDPIEETDEEDVENDGVSEWAMWEEAKNADLVPPSIINTPGDKISRIEFAEAIYELAQKFDIDLILPEENITVLDEGLSKGEKNKILKLYNAEIVYGVSKDIRGNIVFNAEAEIAREDVAAIIYRMLEKCRKLNNTNITQKDRDNELYSGVSDYAKDAMIYMYKNDIIKGVGNNNLNPKGNTTCEEAITILYRIYSGEK